MVAAIHIFDPETGKPDGWRASQICELALQKGLLLIHTGRETIKIGPPLNIEDAALEEELSVLSECAEVVFN
ncbi:MAG: hypothetical protein HQ503_12445 [Rhodospirillales bacterium]|nr:hypothetical protein [Rhodospirillales bacterium]